LVTGASGFIGGAVARMLTEVGAVVHGTGCTRPPPSGLIGHRARLPEDAHTLLEAVHPEIVLHLAAPVSLRSDEQTRAALDSGIAAATQALAEATAAAGARLVHISSCAVYEGGQAPFDEGQALNPGSPYGQLKLAAEQIVMAQISQGLRASILRPFRTYGPGCTTGLIAEACQAAASGLQLQLTDGRQVREWNHVDDIARGIICAAQHAPTGSVWNIGGGHRLSVASIAARIYAAAGRSSEGLQIGAQPRRAGEVDRFWGDHRRAEARWGPLGAVDLDTGLHQTLAWHQMRCRAAT
jgi:UDP-glucose 4-epimerase